MQDPLISGVRFHTVVFVETDADGGGYIHHVTGDIASANGMTYQRKPGRSPEQSDTFQRKSYLGQIRVSDYPNRVEQVLQSVPPPPRQRVFNPSTMAYEQCKPDGSLYAPHETRPPYSKCTEWTEQRAIPALQQHGLIHTSGATSSTDQATTSSSQASVSGASGSSGWVWDEQNRGYRYWDGRQWVWQ